MQWIQSLRAGAVVSSLALLATVGSAQAQCVGDCDGNGEVSINELILAVNIALGNASADACAAADADGNGEVSINELIMAVNNALSGCPGGCGNCDDGDACTDDSCDSGQCVNDPVTCQDDGNECTAESCDAASGCVSENVADGTACNNGEGNCQTGGCVANECTDPGQCDDQNECTTNTCDNNTCVTTPVVDGTSCTGGSCQGGSCVAFECVNDVDCDDSDACTNDVCEANSCVRTDVTCQDDGNDCTSEVCDMTQGCVSNNVPDGTACNGGSGTCTGGSCGSVNIEYQQDFESLVQDGETSLSDDGWIVFGNVFNGQTGRYMYGYGSFPAPNGGAAFCAIADGQGGPDQGNQQFSIYNDYDNQDHANGHLIESNVFRERRITADDIGNTITLAFDGKRGNINDPASELCPCTSTAFAFIKILNPAAGFSTTALVEQEATDFPDTWGGYSISLPVNDAALVNQVLQVGFVSTATMFQPSAIFYDNIVISWTPSN